MPNEVTRKAEELVASLRQLQRAANETGESVISLDTIFDRLVGVNLSNIRESATLIADFNKQIKSMGADADTIKQLDTSLVQLLQTIQATVTVSEKMSSLGKVGRAKQLLGQAVISGDVAEQQRQQQVIQQQRALAEQAHETLANVEKIWQTNLDIARRIEETRNKVLASLYSRKFQRMVTPELPAGALNPTFPLLNSGTINLGPGANYTPPPINIPTKFYPSLPAGNVPSYPQLPAGNIVQPPLLPAYTQRSTAYVPQEQYPSEQFINQWHQNRMPVPSVPQAMPQLYSGIKEVDDAINARVSGAATQVENQPVDPKLKTNVDEIDESMAGRVDITGQTRKEASAGRPEIYEKYQPISPDTLKGIGLTDAAAKNLNKTLTDLGMTTAMVTQNSTELSTGITTLSLQAVNPATGAVQNFTTHIDKWGNVLADTQKRFRSFGSAVMRDVVEVLKWTIAITAIYTPIRKMGEVLEEAKKIQLDMVDVQVALGSSTRSLNEVWDASSEIATQTSSAIEGVIAGYGLAVEATASVRGETNKMITTETLLKDSMILSKLAGTDQKAALDTLVGGLSQLGMGLGQGTQLLDSWVAVSKKANVNVNQMAQSFSIVGSAAEEAGLNYNELNALVGTLAQNTILSGQEIGNSIRGIVAAMQTDKAQTEFAKYGIATKTVSGDFRDLMDILRQIKVMSDAGIIDEKAMGALMQAGGAGARRGAQLAAIVQNLPMVMDLVTVSENANGEAAQAMGLEMKTLDAATTRLNNAFTELGVTLGGEGGILGFLTDMTNLVSGLVKGVSGLVGIMRGAAPVFATFLLAKGALNTPTGATLTGRPLPSFLQNAFTPAGTMVAQGAGQVAIGSSLGNILSKFTSAVEKTTTKSTLYPGLSTGAGTAQVLTMGQFFSNMWGKVNQPITKAPLGGEGKNISLGTLLGPAAIIALSNIGTPLKEAAPRVGLGIAGGLLGALTGNPLIATLGATMAMGFYDKFLTFDENLAAEWTKAAEEARKGGAQGTGYGTPEEELNALADKAIKGMSGLEQLRLSVQQGVINASSMVASTIRPALGMSDLGLGKQISKSETALYLAQNGGVGVTGEQVWSKETAQAFLDAYNAWVLDQANKGLMGEGNIPKTPIETAVVQQIQDLSKYAATASAEMMQQAMEDIANNVSGSIASYTTSQQASETLASTTGNLLVAMRGAATPEGKTIIPAVSGLPQMKDMEAIKFVASLSEEQMKTLTSALTEYIMGTNAVTDIVGKMFTKGISVDDMDKLNSIIDEYNNKVIDATTATEKIQGLGGIVNEAQVKDLASYVAQVAKGKTELQGFVPAFQQANLIVSAQAKLKEVVTVPEMTPDELSKVMEAADKMWRDYLKASGLTDEEIDAYIADTKAQLLKVGDEISGLQIKTPQDYLNQATQNANIQAPSFGGFQDLRSQGVTKASLNSLMPFYNQLAPALQKALGPLGFKLNEQYTMFNTKDGFQMLHVDNSILNLLMQDLIDTEKDKGLQGMYNLPSEGTFYVPVTAYEMSKATTTEMAGGGGGINLAGLQSIVDNMLAAAQALTTNQSLASYVPNVGGTEPLPETFEFGGQTYNQFGPPKPSENPLLGYTTGNPLPVIVTNLQQTPTPTEGQSIPGVTPGPWANGYVFPTTPQTTTPNIPNSDTFFSPLFDPLKQTFDTLIGTLDSIWNSIRGNPNKPQTYQVPPDTAISPTSLALPSQTETKPMTTALNLSVDSKITLTVDGRTLATIIKPYLYEDLIRYGTSQPASTTRSVIA